MRTNFRSALRRLVLAASVLCAGLLSLAPVASAASGGSISGHIYGPDGTPVGNICTLAEGAWHAYTDATGAYRIDGLPPGEYLVQFNCKKDGGFAQQWFAGKPDPAGATLVTVTEGAAQAGIDATLTLASTPGGATISGTVTDAGGSPLGGACVSANRPRPNDDGWDELVVGSTHPDGTYELAGVSAGDVRLHFLDCTASGHHVEEWWDDASSFDTSTGLTVVDGQSLSGIDASLAAGGVIEGDVIGPDGGPLEKICVMSIHGDDPGDFATTDRAGHYVLDGVRPGLVTVLFDDCNSTGSYARQWWPGTPDDREATVLAIAAGQVVTGIDATMQRAQSLSGRVTDGLGAGVPGICVSISGGTASAGAERTDGNGEFTAVLDRPGAHRVQFVDCRSTPTFAGQWYGGTADEASASWIEVPAGVAVSGIDAVLAPGAPGSIAGRVTNLAGVPMADACVIAFVPEHGIVADIEEDGTYLLTGLGAGTWFLAYFDCEEGLGVTDPVTGRVTYRSVWWPNAVVGSDDGSVEPDPVAQGAGRIVVAPGQALTGYDHCFGCDGLVITSMTAGDGTITIAFSHDALTRTAKASASGVAVMAADPDVVFTATCTSTTGGPSRQATGTSSPLVVGGLASGMHYACALSGSDGGVTVATAAQQGVTLTAADLPSGLGGEGVPSTTEPASSRGPAPASAGQPLAVTGTGTAMLVLLGMWMIVTGWALVAARRLQR